MNTLKKVMLVAGLISVVPGFIHAASPQPTPGSTALFQTFRSDSFPGDIRAALVERGCNQTTVYWTEGLRTCKSEVGSKADGVVVMLQADPPNTGSVYVECNAETGLYEQKSPPFCS